MDNPDPALQTNPDPTIVADPTTNNVEPTIKADPKDAFSWKSQLNPDYAESPTMKLFSDDKEGFNNAVKSHLSLTKMLGNEKVPIPKGPDDIEAQNLFNKALGVPETPDGYGLNDVDVPDVLRDVSFDKAKFAEIVHKYNLTPDAAKGLWNDYTEMSMQNYSNAMKAQEDKMTEVKSQMMQEWGDAYKGKVELGQMVINKFSDNPEMNDYITSTLASDPRGIKFLAKVGEQFKENKIGDFKYQTYSITPDEAKNELASIRGDFSHPYNNGNAPQKERDAAIEYVNSLIRVSRGQ